MNLKSLMAVTAIAAFLAACGGGGGGGGGSSSAASTSTTPATSVCPDGSAVPAGGTSACAKVVLAGAALMQVATTSNVVMFPVSGTLDPTSVNSNSVVVWRSTPKTSTIFGGDVSLSDSGERVKIAFPRRLGEGHTYPVTVDVLDTLGRPVSFVVSLSTPAANCSDTTIWSNPGYFSKTLDTCVAYIGVQAKLDQVFNKMQDNTCTLALNSPLSEYCADYLSNGTIRLAETQIVVNSNPVTWAFTAQDAVLLDTNDPWNTRPNVVAKLAAPLPNAISTVTGNSTGGYFVTTVDGKGYQSSLTADNKIILTCRTKC